MLWLSLHCPDLALECVSRAGGDATNPFALCEGEDRQARIHVCNAAAAATGIQPGMTLNAALSLCQSLQTQRRDPELEHAALHSLGAWAGQFTSFVCLQPDGLLLEIEGSLKLFGGLQALRLRIERSLRQLGYRVRSAVAPTPLGSWLLMRAGYHKSVVDLLQLNRLLRSFPVKILERPEHVLQALRGLGLDTIGDCLHQPRAALSRRLGPEFLSYLDRALGRVPDPRPPFRPPARFHSRLLLPAEVDNTEALLFAVRRQLLELNGFLLARGAGVQTLQLSLGHRNRPPSRLELGLLQPSRSVRHLHELLREQLERCQLAAPVDELILSAERLLPLRETSQGLFADPAKAQQDWAQLVERLRARLGADAVRGLCPLPDHRPERAWQFCAPGETHAGAPLTPRPVWLLEQPRLLDASEGYPWLDGRLQLRLGPERIESGWWDDDDIARDYFVAENAQRERFWIYRELRRPQRWFLHGIFA